MNKIFKFIKYNKGTIILGVIFFILGCTAFTSKNNKTKEELEKTYISQEETLKAKSEELNSIDDNIKSTNAQIEDIKNYIDENSK